MRCLTWQCSLYNSAKKKTKSRFCTILRQDIISLFDHKQDFCFPLVSEHEPAVWSSWLSDLDPFLFQKIFPHPQKLTHTPSLDLKFCPHCKETICFLLLHFSGNFKQVRDGKMLRWMQRCPLQWHRKSHEQMYNHNQAGFDLFTAVPENDTYCVQI